MHDSHATTRCTHRVGGERPGDDECVTHAEPEEILERATDGDEAFSAHEHDEQHRVDGREVRDESLRREPPGGGSVKGWVSHRWVSQGWVSQGVVSHVVGQSDVGRSEIGQSGGSVRGGSVKGGSVRGGVSQGGVSQGEGQSGGGSVWGGSVSSGVSQGWGQSGVGGSIRGTGSNRSDPTLAAPCNQDKSC